METAIFKMKTGPQLRWHHTKSSDCQVKVRDAPSNLYGVNVTKAVIGAYMLQRLLVQQLILSDELLH